MKSDYDTKKAKLDAAAGQVKNYENGFLQETKQLDKEIMTIAEYLMRILEKLDGYQIAEVNSILTLVVFTFDLTKNYRDHSIFQLDRNRM